MSTPSARFASAVRILSQAAVAGGLVAPVFRSPPHSPGAVRTIRRSARGVTVAVQVYGRPWVHVLADCVDGVVAANRLSGADAIRARTALWSALESRQAIAA